MGYGGARRIVAESGEGSTGAALEQGEAAERKAVILRGFAPHHGERNISRFPHVSHKSLPEWQFP
jgi:hypothetical protein